MSPYRPPVTILTSGIGLGVYIPALLIQRQLADRNINSDVEVLEAYYSPEALRRHFTHKEAFRRNFALALLANRMARNVSDCIDNARIGQLLSRWTKESREDFIVWSGFWLPILAAYRQLLPGVRLHIDLCRIDADISASFRAHQDLEIDGTEIWLWNWSEKRVVREIPIATRSCPPVPFSKRERRIVVHGGGWGLGTYESTLPELAGTTYALDVVVYDERDYGCSREGDRRLRIDPSWQPWHRGPNNQHSFPAVVDQTGSSDLRYCGNNSFHEMYNVIRGATAILSKPGGGTLIDSLNSATPVILLEAYGQAEGNSAALWEHLGYGIPFSKWKATGYDEAVLERLHANILARPHLGPGYPAEYAERFETKWMAQP